jgi:hypothetical protein
MSYATARRRDSNGEANKLYPEDRPVHDWYCFVLCFPVGVKANPVAHFASRVKTNWRLPSRLRPRPPSSGASTWSKQRRAPSA